MSTELFPGIRGAPSLQSRLKTRIVELPGGQLNQKKISHNTLKKVWEEKDYRRVKEVKICTQEKSFRGACSKARLFISKISIWCESKYAWEKNTGQGDRTLPPWKRGKKPVALTQLQEAL